MGNCIINTTQFSKLQKIKDFMCCNGENINLTVPIENKDCEAYKKGLSLRNQAFTTSSAAVRVECKAPPVRVCIDDDNDDDNDDDHDIVKPVDLCKLRKAIVVVSKEQLELLLRNSKTFCNEGIAVRFSDTFEFDEPIARWRPALPTIPEAHKC